MKFGAVIFPGSNCDHDMIHVLEKAMQQEVLPVWYKEERLPDLGCVVLPGVFSYGDHLRAGAVARFSPIMNAVAEYAGGGGLTILNAAGET